MRATRRGTLSTGNACACGVRTRSTYCAFCRRTMRLIRERRCVACTGPVTDWTERIEGRCDHCRSRGVVMCDATKRLLILASKARYRERAA